MNEFEDVPALIGERVRLEPLGDEHVDALVVTANAERDSYRFTSVPDSVDAMAAYVRELAELRDAGAAYAFAQIRMRNDEVVGATRFLSLRRRTAALSPFAVEIGGTWLSAAAQRTGVNLEAKLLLMTFAFETWRVGRVDFRTDARNGQSRTAILGLGAQFEAVLRNWQPSQVRGEESMLRDSAMYSITDDDWPTVQAALLTKLDTQATK
jgi:RimJ/RimL family protein N-acetyltransferase